MTGGENQDNLETKKNQIIRYILIGCGALLLNLMYVLVTVPYGIINGGVTSLSMILSRLPVTGLLPVNAWVTIVTGLLLLLCWLFLGKENLLGSIFSCVCGVAGFNLFIIAVPQQLMDVLRRFGEIGANPVLPAGTIIELVAAAALVGCGYYLCLSNNATAVGMDTIALILHAKNERIPVAYAMYAINIIVLLLGVYTYGILCVIVGIAFAGIQALTLNTLLKSREAREARREEDRNAQTSDRCGYAE